jgi:hypothetical protein
MQIFKNFDLIFLNCDFYTDDKDDF